MRVLAVIALLIVASLLSACQIVMGPTPGENAKDRDSMRKAEPVIAAIEKFHSAHGYYPKKLDELVPHYIADGATFAPFRYGVWKGEYSLDFSYVTGMLGFQSITGCTYEPKKKKWRCGGYM